MHLAKENNFLNCRLFFAVSQEQPPYKEQSVLDVLMIPCAQEHSQLQPSGTLLLMIFEVNKVCESFSALLLLFILIALVVSFILLRFSITNWHQYK